MSGRFGVVLGDLSDFIAPSQACVKPMQIDARRTSAMLIELEDDAAGGDGSARGPPASAAVAKVTLNDCLACSGCVTSAETVLIGQQSASEFLAHLGTARPVVVSLSPAARASLAVHYGLSSVRAFRALGAAFGALGAAHVLDLGLASDLSLVESAAEFIHRFRAAGERARGARAGAAGAAGAPAAPEEGGACLPVISSSCPGWVCYVEKVHGKLLPHLSAVKSPQQVMGSLVRTMADGAGGVGGGVGGGGGGADAAERAGAAGSAGRVYHCAVMPCFDKKLEASRPDFASPESAGADSAGADGAGVADGADGAEVRDVDCVLSAAEVVELFEQSGVDVATIAAAQAAADAGARDGLAAGSADGAGGRSAGAGASSPALRELAGLAGNIDLDSNTFRAPPGGSGGYADYIFRAAAAELFGVHYAPDAPLPWAPVRNNADMRELKLEIGGEVRLAFAAAHGFRNIQNVVAKLGKGRCAYDYVEMMACPSGCLNGGGQVRPPTGSAEGGKQRLARVREAHHASAGEARLGWPSPAHDRRLLALYAPGAPLEGGPMSAGARALLHTRYHAREKFQSGLGIQW